MRLTILKHLQFPAVISSDCSSSSFFNIYPGPTEIIHIAILQIPKNVNPDLLDQFPSNNSLFLFAGKYCQRSLNLFCWWGAVVGGGCVKKRMISSFHIQFTSFDLFCLILPLRDCSVFLLQAFQHCRMEHCRSFEQNVLLASREEMRGSISILDPSDFIACPRPRRVGLSSVSSLQPMRCHMK